ncbi:MULTISPECIES: uracil-DNA glycosylase [Paraburkholderia]|uniref:Uracil-DNA glycosylase n=1 Tax=Paraburkholderia podalyriae TaxID=1938811 RepID=A0ABR7Q1L5_9BURK|nr:uracil-DNA glycosylase [Paraburkholderia podalyriae]MBC8752413.1 uracil-DNA glycosylase [Paraburkholderia podalyriae]
MEHRQENVDRPKSLGDAAVKAIRIRQLHEPHVAPLTAYVEELRLEAGPGAEIPDFDPWDAGVDAEVLFLLEAPGARAVASTFVSRNNPDETAKNMFLLHQDACIPRTRSLLWNVVPWYIGDGARIRAATPQDLEQGLKPLPRLIQMLPKLRAVVFMGKNAQQAQPQVAALRPDLRLFACAHPSPKVINTRPGNREAILTVLRGAATFLEQAPSTTQCESQPPRLAPIARKPLTRDEQVAQHITQVLRSLVRAQKSEQAKETTVRSFSQEIDWLNRALMLLGSVSPPTGM